MGKESLFVGFTLDGNRRLKAEELGINTSDLTTQQIEIAYRAGGEVAKNIIEEARELRLSIIALWALSCKNMEQRPDEQKEAIFRILDDYLKDLDENWIDKSKNSEVKLVHLGRREMLEQSAPDVMKRLDALRKKTCERTGMVVALCLDYDTVNEHRRALRDYLRAGIIGGENGPTINFEQFLDLAREGVPYQELDLRIRTGEDGGRYNHNNGFLNNYDYGEARDVYHKIYLPDYTIEMFRRDVKELMYSPKRRGA